MINLWAAPAWGYNCMYRGKYLYTVMLNLGLCVDNVTASPPTGMVGLQSGSAAVQINSRSVLQMPQKFQQWSADVSNST